MSAVRDMFHKINNFVLRTNADDETLMGLSYELLFFMLSIHLSVNDQRSE